jgi:hypothetical protein
MCPFIIFFFFSFYAMECPEVRYYEIHNNAIVELRDRVTGEGFFISFAGPLMSSTVTVESYCFLVPFRILHVFLHD